MGWNGIVSNFFYFSFLLFYLRRKDVCRFYVFTSTLLSPAEPVWLLLLFFFSKRKKNREFLPSFLYLHLFFSFFFVPIRFAVHGSLFLRRRFDFEKWKPFFLQKINSFWYRPVKKQTEMEWLFFFKQILVLPFFFISHEKKW